jgi:cell shape-determining protein MreD
MLASVFLVLFTLALEVIPLYLYFLREAKKGAFTQEAWMVIGAVIFVLFLVNLFVTALSMRLGVKRFERLENTS